MDLTDNVIEEVQKRRTDRIFPGYPAGKGTESWHPDRTGTGILFHWNAADQADPQDHP